MTTALRVLTAINQQHRPSASDLRDLRAYAKAGTEDLPADELACEIIEQALNTQQKKYGATAA